MAEPALLDHFDLRHYPPHLFDPDLHLADHDLPLGNFAGGDDCDGLDFDLPADFSVDDFLLRSPDRSDSTEGSAAGSGPAASPSSPTASGTGSAVADASCEVKHEDSDEGRSGGGGAPNWTLKRKQPSPAASSEAATKCRRSGETSLSPSASASRAPAVDSDDGGTAVGGEEDDTRRAARLIRNRESAQLSRQRKKRYVEELEEKVKTMNSVINDLNSRISFVVAENATLRQQLGGGGGGPPPGVYPPGAIPGMHFPWVPGYALRPHGSHVPLVPIPRLKPQQPVAAATKVTKKTDNKKASDSKSKTKTKTKKVASVSLIGLMFVMLILGAFVPGFNHSFGMRGRSDGAMLRNFDQAHDRVVSVSNNHGKVPTKGGLNSSDLSGGDSGAMMGTEDSAEQKHRAALNSSETLPALLYVPRNGKHVKINGNLIIHSVLASEKAVAHETSLKHNSDQSGIDHKATSIAIARHLSLPGNDMNPQEKSPVDGPLPQWFREGMAGPILNSGMCSEVFQFDISTASTNSAGIIPASPSVNSSSVNATRPTPAPVYRGKLKNRRIMYNEAIPLTGKTVNNTEPFNRTSESTKLPDKKPASSVVVSVLADPREAGDGDSDPRMSPKSLSRIFVVVLLDGVRYVTYSCTLPFKSSSPHLVN